MSHLSPIPRMRVGTRAVGVVACRRRVTNATLRISETWFIGADFAGANVVPLEKRLQFSG